MINGSAAPHTMDFDGNTFKFLNFNHPSNKGTWFSHLQIKFWTSLLMLQGLKGKLIEDRIIDKFEIIENGIKKEIYELK